MPTPTLPPLYFLNPTSPNRLLTQHALQPLMLPLAGAFALPLALTPKTLLVFFLGRLARRTQRTQRLSQGSAFSAPAIDVDEHHDGKGEAYEEGEEPEGLIVS
jgi:hypothetical protein